MWSLPSPITSCDDLKGVYCEDAVCLVMPYLTSQIKVSTVHVFRLVEGMVMMDNNLKVVLATGDKLAFWNLNVSSKVSEVEVGSDNITSMRGHVYTLHCATPDHNLLTISNSKQTVTGCTVVNNDEVLDLVLMGESSTPLGHSDTALCLATCSGDTSIIACGGEDWKVRVWRLEQDRLECLVVASGRDCV